MLLTVTINFCFATEAPENIQRDVDVKDNRGEAVDLDLLFADQNGEQKSLRELIIPGRPTLISPVYFECPRLCGLTLGAVANILRDIDLELGQDFKILSVSFNPQETYEQAKETASKYYKLLDKPDEGVKGWGFVTGTQQNIDKLMSQIGFQYVEDNGEYSHASALMIITPEGKISRYFYGLKHDPRNIRLSLIDASRGKIGGAVDKFLLYCFRFDPLKGKYTLVVMNVMRVICLAVLFVLVAVLLTLKIKEKQRENADV